MSARDQSSAPLLQIGDDVFVNDGGDLELCTQKKNTRRFRRLLCACMRVCDPGPEYGPSKAKICL